MTTTVATYDTYRAAVDADLRAALSQRQGLLYDLVRYHLGWVDERGNPADGALTPLHYCGLLSLAAADAVSGDYHPAVPARVVRRTGLQLRAGAQRRAGRAD